MSKKKIFRLQKSDVDDLVDTVIIQYTYNDWGENNSYKKNTLDEAREKFNVVSESDPISFLKKLRKSFRYSLTIPIDLITKKNQIMDFDHHKKKLYEVIKKFPFLNDVFDDSSIFASQKPKKHIQNFHF